MNELEKSAQNAASDFCCSKDLRNFHSQVIEVAEAWKTELRSTPPNILNLTFKEHYSQADLLHGFRNSRESTGENSLVKYLPILCTTHEPNCCRQRLYVRKLFPDFFQPKILHYPVCFTWATETNIKGLQFSFFELLHKSQQEISCSRQWYLI